MCLIAEQICINPKSASHAAELLLEYDNYTGIIITYKALNLLRMSLTKHFFLCYLNAVF